MKPIRYGGRLPIKRKRYEGNRRTATRHTPTPRAARAVCTMPFMQIVKLLNLAAAKHRRTS